MDEAQGGNAGTTTGEPVEQLRSFQRAGIPIWLPLVTWASDAGSGLQFTVVNFVCVMLDPIGNAAADWTGTVLDPASDEGKDCSKGVGLPTGGQPPAEGLDPVYNYRLTR